MRGVLSVVTPSLGPVSSSGINLAEETLGVVATAVLLLPPPPPAAAPSKPKGASNHGLNAAAAKTPTAAPDALISAPPKAMPTWLEPSANKGTAVLPMAVSGMYS